MNENCDKKAKNFPTSVDIQQKVRENISLTLFKMCIHAQICPYLQTGMVAKR
jgi:hypothetical protein